MLISNSSTVPDELHDLIRAFIKKSGDHERTVESVKRQIRDVISTDNGKLWLIRKGKTLSGYFFAEIVQSEYETTVCLVHQVMVRDFEESLLKTVDMLIERWAKEHKAKEMAFFTRRNSQALKRSLDNGWFEDSIVLKRKIEE